MLFLLTACFEPATQLPTPIPAPAKLPLAEMRNKPLNYTRHAECRMSCRNISETEVKRILASGTWDSKRSRDDGRCPSHALEGKDDQGGPLRIVFADCAREVKVITAIDLDDDFDCVCK